MSKMRMPAIMMAAGLVSMALSAGASVGMSVQTWEQHRPVVPVKQTARFFANANANGGAYADDAAIAKAVLPLAIPADAAWSRVATPPAEYLSACDFKAPEGVKMRFAVYGQYGCKTAYYWTGEGYAPRTFADEAVGLDAATNFVRQVLCGGSTGPKVTGVSAVLDRAAVTVSERGEPVEIPFAKFRFVFVDDAPGANWSHPCRYVFLAEDLSAFAVSYRRRAPQLLDAAGARIPFATGCAEAACVDIAQVKASVRNGFPEANSNMSAADAEHLHFVIIGGGEEPSNNGIRFWADCAMLYSTLTLKYGVPAPNIHTYISDGTNPANDANLADTDGITTPVLVSSPTDLDGDGDCDVDGAATLNNVKGIFTTLKNKLTASDRLFVFLSSHGDSKGTAGESNHDCIAVLFSPNSNGKDADGNSIVFSDADLHTWTSGIKCPVVFAIETCYAGGFIDNIIATPNRAVATACNHHESSRGGSGNGRWGTVDGVVRSGKTCGFNYWAVALNAALRGVKPMACDAAEGYVNLAFPWTDGTSSADADANGDGGLTFDEVRSYAAANDSNRCRQYVHYSCGDAEHPQFGESTSGVARSFALTAGESPVQPGTHTVTFYAGDYGWFEEDGEFSYEIVRTVGDGESAKAPAVYADEGFRFTGWDTSFSRVTRDLEVTALYREVSPYDDAVVVKPGCYSTFETDYGEQAVVVGVRGAEYPLTQDDFCEADYYGASCLVSDGIVDAEKEDGDADDNWWCGQISEMNMLYLSGWAKKSGLAKTYETVDDLLDYFRENPTLLRYATTPGDVTTVREGTYGYDNYGNSKFFNWFKTTTKQDLATYLKSGKAAKTSFVKTLVDLLGQGKYVMNLCLDFPPGSPNERWTDLYVTHWVTCVGYTIDPTMPLTDPTALTGLFIIDSDNDQNVSGGGRGAPNSIIYCPTYWCADENAFQISGLWGWTAELPVNAPYTQYKALAVQDSTVYVTFNGQGADDYENETREYEEGDVYGSFPEVYKSGCTLRGWYTSASGGTKLTEDSLVSSKQKTVYAQWDTILQRTLKVTGGFIYDSEHDKNVTSLKLWPDDMPMVWFDESKIIDARTQDTVGAFQCWTVSPVTADLGEDFSPFDEYPAITMPNCDVTLTAKYVSPVAAWVTFDTGYEGWTEDADELMFYWSPDKGATLYPCDGSSEIPVAAGTLTVKFYVRDRSGRDVTSWKVPGDLTFSIAKPTPEDGPAYLGGVAWFVAADGAKQIAFDANGGKATFASAWYIADGGYYQLPEVAERVGYEFDGWWTDKTYGEQVVEGDLVDFSKLDARAPKLYAHWLKMRSATVTGGWLNGESAKLSDLWPGDEVSLGFDYEKLGTAGAFQCWQVTPADADLGEEFDPFSPETTFVMPNADVKITAKYEKIAAAYVAFEFAYSGEVEEDTCGIAYWSPDKGKTKIPAGLAYPVASGTLTVTFYAPSSDWKAPADLKLTVDKLKSWTEREEDDRGRMVTVTYYDSPAEISKTAWFVAADGAKQVAFDADGGKATFASAWFADGGEYYQLPEVAERTGYEFDGWWTGKVSGEPVNVGDAVDFSKLDARTPKLYARWLKMRSATVTGGWLNGESTKLSDLWPGDEVMLSFDCEKLGKTGEFQCWQVTPADADLGDDFDPFSPETTFVMPNADVKITAKYEKNVAAHVAFAFNFEGEVEEDSCGVACWSPDKGKTKIPAGLAYPVASGALTVTFYAPSSDWKAPADLKLTVDKLRSWTEREEDDRGRMVTVTYYDSPAEISETAWFVAADGAKQVAFNANGGKVSVANAWFLPDGSYYMLPHPDERKGYVFNGWWTDKTGGKPVAEGDAVDFGALDSKKPELFAHWLKAYSLKLKGEAVAQCDDGSEGDASKPVSVLEGDHVLLSAPEYTESRGATLVFQRWTVSPDKGFLGTAFDATACETDIVMPAADVTFTPNYIDEEKCAWMTMQADESEMTYEVMSDEIALVPPVGEFEWSPDGKVWYRSGATALLPAGTYNVTWRSQNPSWEPPTAKQSYKLKAGESADNSEDPAVFTFVPVVRVVPITCEDGEYFRACPDGCSTSMNPKDGKIPTGKTLALTAKTDKKNAFVGWMPLAVLESYGVALPYETAPDFKVDAYSAMNFLRQDEETGELMAEVAAVFRPVSDYRAEDMEYAFLSIYCGFYFDGESYQSVERTVSYDGVRPSVTVPAVVGCAVDYELDFSGLVAPLAFKTSGKLPQGVKFAGGRFTGTPTAKKGEQTQFLLTATDPAGHSNVLEVNFDVMPLPTWLACESRAMLMDSNGNATGLLELSVTDAGKVSGKIITESGSTSVTPTLTWQPGCDDGDEGSFGISWQKVSRTLCLEAILNVSLASDGTGGMVTYEDYSSGFGVQLNGQLYSADKALLDDAFFKSQFCNKYYTAALEANGFDGSLTDASGQEIFWESPEGYFAPGYLTIKTDAKGVAKVAGKLADGQAISCSGTLLPLSEYEAMLLVFVSPSAYKKSGLVALSLLLSADGCVTLSENGLWKTPPILPATAVDPAPPIGLIWLNVNGHAYGSIEQLESYYATFSADTSYLSYEYSYKDSNKDTVVEYAGCVLAPSVELKTSKTGLTVPASKKIWKDSDGYYQYGETKPDRYGDTEEITNPTEATVKLEKATGIFSGKFNAYFDYETPTYTRDGDENWMPQHKAVSISYTGVIVDQGDGNFFSGGSGQYSAKHTLTWEDPATGRAKTATYTEVTAVPAFLELVY